LSMGRGGGGGGGMWVGRWGAEEGGVGGEEGAIKMRGGIGGK